MRVVEDEYGNRFLEIEGKRDFEEFKRDVLDKAKKKEPRRRIY
jgi:hypothetical protein